MSIRIAFVIGLSVVLAGCSGGNSARYMIDTPVAETKTRAIVGTLMLRQVSLPTYAAAEEISRQDADGAVRDTGAGLWADEPVRGVTLALARQLDTITSATVAAEPWPLIGIADAVLEVRVERMVAGSDGQFHLTGQYFVSGDGVALSPIAASFEIATPVEGEGVGAIVNAQSRAIGQLAQEIARRISR